VLDAFGAPFTYAPHTGEAMRTRALLPIVVTVALIGLTACSRGNDTATDGTQSTAPSGSTTTAPTGTSFGDLHDVCGPAPAGTTLRATDTGVTASTIQLSAFSDVGFAGRPGLNQELFDSSTAFTKWCNAAGGINGRKIKLELRDAALTAFKQRVIDACAQHDFMMVGGGAAFDDQGQGERLACGLPNVAAYVVSPQAVGSDLTYEPVTNPGPHTMLVGDLRYLGRTYPDATKKIALFAGAIGVDELLARKIKEVITGMGWQVVYDQQYNPDGESTWRPFVEGMRAAGVRGVIFVGEPVGFGQVISAAADAGYQPDFFRTDGNGYDSLLVSQAGRGLRHTYVPSVFYPFLDPATAAKNPATKQYRDLIQQYVGSKGKVTGLGVQSMSAWLLFATAARDCGADLTRDCVWANIGKQTAWTGGGLHAAQDVADHKPGDCEVTLSATPTGFSVVDTAANRGVYTCDARNVATLTGNHGAGVKCPNPAFRTDQKPSNCAKP
jgi:ABC-type branched-subunit amino acid transport system substrate-binding protein